MTVEEYLDEIKLELTGGLLELEIGDKELKMVLDKSLREVNRYIDSTCLVTVPFATCIDLTNSNLNNVNAITHIYRTEGYLGDSSSTGSVSADPMYAQMWMAFSNGGTMYNLNDYVLNYASWNTLMQIKNTTSTDLAFKYDKLGKKLYINTAYDKPANITIEYIPNFTSVEQIESQYWTDVILRLSVAMTKQILGRIRSRYTLSGAQWAQDGEKILEEGTTELKELRERLNTNAQLNYPVD